MSKKNIIKIIGSLLLIGIVAFIVVACAGPKTIDINQYVEFEFLNWDGYSKNVATIDYEKLFEENQDAFKVDKNDDDKIDALKEELKEAISGELDSFGGNKNGDKITFKWKNNLSEFEEKYKVKFSFSDIEVVVEGLPPLEEVDLFANISVKFEGIAPFITAKIDGELPEEGNEFTLNIDKTEGLSIGDIVTITASIELPEHIKTMEDYFGWKGLKIKSLTKEFEVSGLKTIVTNINQIPEDTANAMQKYVLDVKNVAFEESEIATLKEMKCIGAFLFSKENANAVTNDNVLYYIYEISMTINSTNEDVTYYIYGKYTNIILDEEGKANVDVSTCKMPEASSLLGMIFGEGFVKGDILIQGFETYEEILNACKEANNTMVFTTDITK